ncbi:MAG: 4Fe-4S dicluster domain-containing protein [Candidatus Schekmanbacteria bacterium]|nr:4Fe-4S dicluster domain-containing protein [Candidatus Schekmanbacteria bacterium]
MSNPSPTVPEAGGCGCSAAPSRRDFLGAASGVLAGFLLSSCTPESIEQFFQKQFREMSPDEVKETIARLEKRHTEEVGKTVSVAATPAQPGVKFGYGLDLSRCIGCRRCVYACVRENNQSRDPQIHWIRVMRQKREKGIDLEGAEYYYDAAKVPEDGYFYMPIQCQQCENPPCVRVCPVGATWKEPDGIVVVDYDWCIGCRCCVAACPYGARHFNWGDPYVPADEVNPDTHYLGNRPRSRGVVEKCTFCIQRVRKEQGRYPACVEICPVGARKFGNLLDPESEIRYLLDHKRVFVLKAELKTEPKFFYFYAT